MWRIGSGYLALSLHTFEAMTARECQWRLEQALEREHREFTRIAQLACWVLNPWMKPGQQIEVHHLLGGRALPPPPDE